MAAAVATGTAATTTENHGVAISVGLLDGVEQAMGVRFPRVYRSWILARNGGTIDVLGEAWTVSPIFDETDRGTMRKASSHTSSPRLSSHGDLRLSPKAR